MATEMVASRPAFWKFLSEWLIRKDWTQMRLADELGVHQTVVGKWLHNDPRRRTRPSRKVDAKLASVLGVSLAELFEMFAADQTAAETKASAELPVPEEEGARAKVNARRHDQLERWLSAVGPENEGAFWDSLTAQSEDTVDLIKRVGAAVSEGPVARVPSCHPQLPLSDYAAMSDRSC